MIKNLLFYVSDSYNPYINLAKEKFLFDSASSNDLILYLWQNQNTVVIGKNQNAFSECRTELLKEENGFLARRLSGGGAVFHDLGNLNFTFICSSDNLNVANHIKVLQLACEKAGIQTEISGRNDILASGRKFSGNAFYNSKGTSYHHGTILINANIEKLGRYLTPPKAKLESKGVKSVKSRVINLLELSPTLTIDKMKEFIISSAEEFYNLKAQPFTKIDDDIIKSLSQEYSNWEYLYGVPLPFNLTLQDRLSFGSVDICLYIDKGIITSIKFYTDALDSELSTKVENALISKPFNLNAIKKELLLSLAEENANEIISLFEKQAF